MNFHPRMPPPRLPLNLDCAVVYDIETLPNCFTLHWLALNSEEQDTFEISVFKDERRRLFEAFRYWQYYQIPMIGFNSLGFDFPIIHELFHNPEMSVYQIYDKAQSIIQSDGNRWGHMIWPNDRFAPQIDLYRIHHMDNGQKRTSLKALEIAMRSETVMECPLPFDQPLRQEDVSTLIAYNKHDVRETRKFAHFSLEAIKFRIGLLDTIDGDVINFNDSKIGSKILEQRLGNCYTTNEGRRVPRQTYRSEIRIADILFPYIRFEHPEFQRALDIFRAKTLLPSEIDLIGAEEGAKLPIKTKGAVSVKVNVGGIQFKLGTGGLHASVKAKCFVATDDYPIVDIDVGALYPNVAIANGLYPEHLGTRFVDEYAKLPIERNKHKKGTAANAALKLAANGTYGNSNSKFSVFYDPQFTMAVTVNGQLMLCMLAEWLLSVDTLQFIQFNTDGISYMVHKDRIEHARLVRTWWERLTRLKFEEAQYKRMWVRDVNSYVAESIDGKLKLKGAYWYPETLDDISKASPPAWHKDFSAQVVIRAAVAHMVHGVDLSRFIHGHADKFDFMLRGKVDRSSRLMIGDEEQQRTTRFYVALNGGAMRKVSPPPPGATLGGYKRRSGVSDIEWHSVMAAIPPESWDARIHTKNKSRYQVREMAIPARYNVAPCNNALDFDWGNVCFDWYIEEAKKLVIP